MNNKRKQTKTKQPRKPRGLEAPKNVRKPLLDTSLHKNSLKSMKKGCDYRKTETGQQTE